jgi:hypothetical protein
MLIKTSIYDNTYLKKKLICPLWHNRPGQPIYGHNLQVQPFHTAEPKQFPEATFDLLSNPLNPRINQAIATLEDLEVTADVFHLRQLPLRYLEPSLLNGLFEA